MSSKILVLPGDGIGVEVADQAIRVIDKLNELGLDATYEKELVGGASYDANGEPLTSEVLEKAKQSDAILLGAVGGSKWDDVCLLYTSPSPRDYGTSRMPSSA